MGVIDRVVDYDRHRYFRYFRDVNAFITASEISS